MARRLFYAILFSVILVACPAFSSPRGFVRVDGQKLIGPDGSELLIRGTNLGNWLNPEGYMFSFSRTNSYAGINAALCQLVGPEFVADFWKRFKDNYITKEDIDFIASCGANTVRVPFHYKLFTDEDYMGLTADQDGFKRLDDIIEWCREAGLYVILDMHDCPAGQTGSNIDDSYGYPWLFESPGAQELFCRIWKDIARHYRNEPVVLGYDLMNEPIAHQFDTKRLNPLLEPLYKRAVAEIRKVDKHHIVMLGGAQWNTNFNCFTDWKFDDNMMYTCHRYKGGKPSVESLQNYVDFKQKTNLPMYMGETGHNTMEWQTELSTSLAAVGIGYTFWPYKKIGGSCFCGFRKPENWDTVVAFVEADRGTYSNIRTARPSQEVARKALNELIENIKFENCIPQKGYIESLQLKNRAAE